MILFAFKLAFENNVEMPGLKKYVEAILNSWSNQGIKTIDQQKKLKKLLRTRKNKTIFLNVKTMYGVKSYLIGSTNLKKKRR